MTSNNQDIEALIPTEKFCFNNSTTATVLAAIAKPFKVGLDNDSKKFNLANKKGTKCTSFYIDCQPFLIVFPSLAPKDFGVATVI